MDGRKHSKIVKSNRGGILTIKYFLFFIFFCNVDISVYYNDLCVRNLVTLTFLPNLNKLELLKNFNLRIHVYFGQC